MCTELNSKKNVEYLEEQARSIHKPSLEDLKEMIHEYRYKLNLIKTKFNK